MTLLTTQRRPVYLDCDTGIDDALAIAMLLSDPTVDVVGIGTVSGNTSSEQAARNTLDLLALAGRPEIPVAVGAHDPLARPFDGGVPHIHGENGIGDVRVPRSSGEAESRSAAELLSDLAREHDGALEVIAIGPLTNLAVALERDATLASRVAHVTVMGGAALAPGNTTPVAEANIANDPEAAAIVVAAGWDFTLVPLDVTMSHTLDERDRAVLAESTSPLLRAIAGMLDVYFDYYAGIYGERHCALHDPLAVAIALGMIEPTVAPTVPIVVDTGDGVGRGQTVCDLRGMRSGRAGDAAQRTRVVLEAATDLAPVLLDRLLGAHVVVN